MCVPQMAEVECTHMPCLCARTRRARRVLRSCESSLTALIARLISSGRGHGVAPPAAAREAVLHSALQRACCTALLLRRSAALTCLASLCTGCPLCLEEMDVTDRNFRPCKCGYQICLFCYRHIKDDLNGLCPACRTPYDEANATFVTPDPQEYAAAPKRFLNADAFQLRLLPTLPPPPPTPRPPTPPPRKHPIPLHPRARLLPSLPTPPHLVCVSQPLHLRMAKMAREKKAKEAKDKKEQQLKEAKEKRDAELKNRQEMVQARAASVASAAGASAAGGCCATAGASVAQGAAVARAAREAAVRATLSARAEPAAAGALRTTVYVTGLSPRLAKEEIMRRQEYFGQYGRILRVALGPPPPSAGGPPSLSCTISYSSRDDAEQAVLRPHPTPTSPPPNPSIMRRWARRHLLRRLRLRTRGFSSEGKVAATP